MPGAVSDTEVVTENDDPASGSGCQGKRKKGSSLPLILVGIQTINMHRISPVMSVVNIALSKVLIFYQRFKFRLFL